MRRRSSRVERGGIRVRMGVGALLFGYGVTMAGMSVGFATIMGINTAVGFLLPFLVKSPADLLTSGGLVILLGIAGCVAGVVVCGRGGFLRERQTGVSDQRRGFGRALLVCAASGVLSACANLGFAFSSRVGEEAQSSALARSFPLLPVGCPSSGERLSRCFFGSAACRSRGARGERTSARTQRDWLMGVLMGIIWFVATIPYGMGAYYLGRLGTSVGWAVYMAFTLLVANIFGFITREWTGAPPRAFRTLYAGLSVLVAAIVVLAIGNSITGQLCRLVDQG